jgi:predicted RNase H-like HicB family nuclease
MNMMELEVIVHHDSETKGFWAEVVQLPGCFAAGHTRAELEEALKEAISLYLQDEDANELLTSDRVDAVERYHFSAEEGLVPA